LKNKNGGVWVTQLNYRDRIFFGRGGKGPGLQELKKPYGTHQLKTHKLILQRVEGRREVTSKPLSV